MPKLNERRAQTKSIVLPAFKTQVLPAFKIQGQVSASTMERRTHSLFE
jgi:hypothetical protein